MEIEDIVKKVTLKSPDDSISVYLDIPEGDPNAESYTMVAYATDDSFYGIAIGLCKLRIRFVIPDENDSMTVHTPLADWPVYDAPTGFNGMLRDLSFVDHVQVHWGDSSLTETYFPPFDSNVPASHTYDDPGDYLIESYIIINGGVERIGNAGGAGIRDTYLVHVE